jgi:hypothetical protein
VTGNVLLTSEIPEKASKGLIISMQLEVLMPKAGRKGVHYLPNGKADVRVHSCFQNYPKVTRVRKLLFRKPEVKKMRRVC